MSVYTELLESLGVQTGYQAAEEELYIQQGDRTWIEEQVYGYTFEEMLCARRARKIYVPYKRLNHLREHCSRLAARHFHNIPAEVLEFIVSGLSAMGVAITDRDVYTHIRTLLKRCKRSDMYRYIFCIIRQLGGPAMGLTYELEQALVRTFAKLERYFLKQPARHNFYSYNLVIEEIAKRIGWVTPYDFPRLKNRKKEVLIREWLVRALDIILA